MMYGDTCFRQMLLAAIIYRQLGILCCCDVVVVVVDVVGIP